MRRKLVASIVNGKVVRKDTDEASIARMCIFHASGTAALRLSILRPSSNPESLVLEIYEMLTNPCQSIDAPANKYCMNSRLVRHLKCNCRQN